MNRPRLLPDNFTLLILAAVLLATWLPARGQVAVAFEWITTTAIGLLFFMHGAKLSREAIVAGLLHWRLHLLVLLFTFAVFPAIGLLARPLAVHYMPVELYSGFLYLCALPATVQSAIAFTSIARGNVPAAICSASASTLLGVFVTPVLVSLLLRVDGASISLVDSITKILLQLMVPFFAGHLARPLLAGFMKRRAALVSMTDRSSILLVVYTAFSAAVVEGLWKQVSVASLVAVLVGSALLLGIVLFLTTWTARLLRFPVEDEITIVFCGSKKSLASGVPMAKLLFPSATVGVMVLPLMVFHQIQLMVCASLAQRYARRPRTDDTDTTPAAG